MEQSVHQRLRGALEKKLMKSDSNNKDSVIKLRKPVTIE